MRLPYHIYIIGLGLIVPNHLTREVEAVLRQCRRVYYAHPWPGVRRRLRSFCRTVIDQGRLYRAGQHRRAIYDTMVDEVIEGARRTAPVAMALYGHPSVYCLPTRLLLDRARQERLRTKVLPGISALDALFVDLELDPAAGLQMYLADEVVYRTVAIQPDIPCLIWQPATVGSLLATARVSRPSRFAPLKKRLLQVYPPSHRVVVARCAMTPREKPQARRVPLGRLETAYRDLAGYGTIFLPPVRPRPPIPRSVVQLAESAEHLRKLTC